MENDKLLGFEEFIKPGEIEIPRYNNLLGYWSKGMIGKVSRNTLHSLKFQKEFPELDKELLIKK